MSVKVELFMQVCLNGRPLWRKARTIRPELTQLMTDKEYDEVLAAGAQELQSQVKTFKEKKAKLEKVQSA